MTSNRALYHLCTITLAILLSAGSARAQLGASPNSLSFTVQNGVASPQQNLTVSASVPATSFTVSGPPWLDIADSSGMLVGNKSFTTPATLIVAVVRNPPTTSQSGAIVLTPSLDVNPRPTTVPVTLTVTPAPGNLTVSPSSVSFAYQTGGPFPPAAYLSVQSTGAQVTFSVSAVTASGGAWLSASASTSITPSTITVSAVPSPTMAPGVYTGTVSVVPSGGGTTQRVSVTLQVFSGGNLTLSPTGLSFSYQAGNPAPPAQAVNVVNSTGGNVAYNVSWVTSTGGNWLSVSPTSGNTPSSVAVYVSPAGLSNGTYYGTVNVYPLAGAATGNQIPVTLTVYSAPSLLVSPTSLTFDYVVGAAAPPAQYLSVTSTGAPITFSAGVNGPSWITLSTSQGTTPTAITVYARPPAGVAPGNYNATVMLTPSAGSSLATSILVRIAPANYISASQSNVSFDYTTGSPNPPPSYVYVTSSGGSLHFTAVGSASGSWLNVSQSSPYTPATVSVTPFAQGLAAGVYTGVISIVADDANNSPLNINVTLNVTTGVTFTSSLWGMSFSYQIGQTATPFQATVINSTGTSLSFNVSATTTSGGAWLLAAGGGTTPSTVAAAVNPKSLTPGTYTGTINIVPADKSVLPLQIPVILNVSAGPVFLPSPNQLSFQYQIGSVAPSAQTLAVNAGAGPPIVFAISTKTGDGGQWVTASPDVAYAPTDVSVTVNPQGLATGTYYAVIILSDPSGNTPTAYVPISFQVSNGPILVVPSQFLSFSAMAGGLPTVAQPIVVGGNGRSYLYHVDTSGGSWLQASPTDGLTDSPVNVYTIPDGLAPGYYLGLVSISIPGVQGSQQLVPIVFLVVPAL